MWMSDPSRRSSRTRKKGDAGAVEAQAGNTSPWLPRHLPPSSAARDATDGIAPAIAQAQRIVFADISIVTDQWLAPQMIDFNWVW